MASGLARADRDGKSSALSIRINQILIHEIVGGHFEETNYPKSAFFSILLEPHGMESQCIKIG